MGSMDGERRSLLHVFLAKCSCLVCVRKVRRRAALEVPEHLRISSSDLHVRERIGQGSASVVYRASWLGCEVAVKELLLVQDVESFNAYPKELEILTRLPHPHVVQLLGFCRVGTPRRLSIVMELLETSLSRVIRGRRQGREPFDAGEAIDIMTKIALGMKFLHSREIVHGGLSTAIIMMNVHAGGEFDVKIAGFAFSDYATRRSSPTVYDRGHADGRLQMEVTKAGDVYCFALICYEILTGFKLRYREAREEIARQVMASVRYPDIDRGFVALLLKCWDGKQERRPSFSVICDALADIRAARDQRVLQKRTAGTEDADALRWTTHKDDAENTYLEIAAMLRGLPDHLSLDPADVEWRSLIGEGGHNRVYEVNWLGCTFAVKRFTSLSARLREEVQFLTQLQHPHIARLIGHSVESTGGWIMTERMDTDLQKLIGARLRTLREEGRESSVPPFNDSEARELCLKVALGLNFLHSKNVVHRDIKPANVLVHDRRGRFDVKITDFGVSHRIGTSAVANFAGTGLWRAPEVLKRGKPLTEGQLKKTDVYSFAMTCYGIVTGHALHEHLSPQDVIEKRRPQLPAAVHSRFRDLICQCWDDDPRVRPDFITICNVLANNIS